MLYKFKHKNYCDFSIFQENTLPPRSYFIPFKDRESCDSTDYLNERYNSDLVTVLSGEWDFIYYRRVKDMPEEIDLYGAKTDKVQVPSCWQFTGYEKPYYVNIRYQFDCTPPRIPADEGLVGRKMKLDVKGGPVTVYNSVGLYRKYFNLERKDKHILSFLGSASNVQVYLNGHYIGYGEGSHNTHEFDITPYVVDGNNELVVLVYKWCNGTYLECQDMFRNNGIFRDVYVTSYEDTYIWDFAVKTMQNENCWTLDTFVDVHGSDFEVEYKLEKDGKVIALDKNKTGACKFDIQKPLLWSAEIPNLYMLYITLYKKGVCLQVIRQEVGFKNIYIDKNVYYFNDKAIKIKGVNHHDTHESKGYVMGVMDYLQDAILMKEYNVNTVRTSHYPPDPIFLKIANYLGLYIIDEADIETHGTQTTLISRPNRISNNKKWKHQYWDRVYRMYQRDKNNACICMWSLGNEAGGWRNQDYCYEKLKELSPIPIHYEGACRTIRWAYDVLSQMYAPTEVYDKYLDKKLSKRYYSKPFFLCEYAHAMGVGPGSLDDYWVRFYKDDALLGGCIWEWADHAVKNSDGTYTYGGDHGEYVHDSNFCVDGLFFPNRKPHTGALCMKAVYRPIRATYMSSNKYVLENTNRFKDSSYLDIQWQYVVSGEVCESGKINQVIQPQEKVEVSIKHKSIDTTKDCFINFIYTDKDTNKIVAKEQIVMCNNVGKSVLGNNGGEVVYIEKSDKITVATNNASIQFDKSDGNILSYVVDGVEYLNKNAKNKGFRLGLYDCPVDNYMYVAKKWKRKGLDKAQCVFVGIESEKQIGKVILLSSYDVLLNGKKAFDFKLQFTVYSDNVIDIKSMLTAKKFYDLPKFGVSIEMPSCYDNVRYYGSGEGENYSDFNSHAIIGVFDVAVNKMAEPYIKPQASGNRSQTRWAEVYDDNSGLGLRFTAQDKPVNFNAVPYNFEGIKDAMHREEIKYDGTTCVHIDNYVRGIGSNSCGPDTRAEYKLNKKQLNLSYEFTMQAVKVNKNS